MKSPIACPTASGLKPAAVKLLTASLLVLALAGCKTLDEPGVQGLGATIVEPTERHPIMVSQQPSTMNVRVARGSQGLTPAQKGQIATFLERYRVADAGNSKLVISVPSGSSNEAAAARAVSEVRHLITAYGFSEANVAVEPYRDARDASAPIRLSYLRYVAEAPECGRWPSNLADELRNLSYPNFGCAQQRNLAAQVANPADLLGPRTVEPADAERRAVVLDRYRQGRTTGAEKSLDERIQVKTSN